MQAPGAAGEVAASVPLDHGADQFIVSADGLRRIVRGHRTVRQWA